MCDKFNNFSIIMEFVDYDDQFYLKDLDEFVDEIYRRMKEFYTTIDLDDCTELKENIALAGINFGYDPTDNWNFPYLFD